MDFNHNTSSLNDNDNSLLAKPNDIKRTEKGAKHEDGRPLRPLSAYEIFFHLERNRIMNEQANRDAKRASVGYDNLADTISARWKRVDGALKIELDAMAKLDKERYDRENEEWKANLMLKKAEEHEAAITAESLTDMVEKTPARDMSLNEPVLTAMATPQGGRQSISFKSGAAIPPLPFKTTPRPRRFFLNAMGGNRPAPHIIP
jgi:hypothetical protein